MYGTGQTSDKTNLPWCFENNIVEKHHGENTTKISP